METSPTVLVTGATGFIGRRLVTDVDLTTGRNLIDSMSTEVVVQDRRILEVVPGEPLPYREAVRRALAERLAEGKGV